MAAQYVDCSGNTADEAVTTGSGGTVTGAVRVIYDDGSKTDAIVAALQRAKEYIATKIESPADS